MITVDELLRVSSTWVNLCDVDTREPIEFSVDCDESHMRDCEVFEIEARVTEDGMPEAMVIDAYIKVPTKEVEVDITATYRGGMVIEVPQNKDTYEYIREYVNNMMDDAPYYIDIQGVDFELADYDHDVW